MKLYLNVEELKIIQIAMYLSINTNKNKLEATNSPTLTPKYAERLQDEIAEAEKLVIYINQKIRDESE